MYKDAKKAESLTEENKNQKPIEEVKKTPFDEPAWENLEKVYINS